MEYSSVIKQQFEGPFGPPATSEQVAIAEQRLGHELPSILKEHYREYDGFHGPTNSRFFYSLQQLVETTLWLRGEGYFPGFIQRSVALGENGLGPYWLILLDQPSVIVEWDAEMEGDDRVVQEGSLTDVWLAEKRFFNQAAGT